MTQDAPPTFYPEAESSQTHHGSLHKTKEQKKKQFHHTPQQVHLLHLICQLDHTRIHLEDHLHHPDPLVQGLQHQHQLHPFLMARNEESNLNCLQFQLTYVIYLMQNETIYLTKRDKILFILSLMTNRVPGKWMKHWMTQYVTK